MTIQAPFTGRKSALQTLRAEADAREKNHGPSMALVLGAQGMGKTRLVREFVASRPASTSLFGSCSDISYGCFSEMLFAHCDLSEDCEDSEFQRAILSSVRSLLPSEKVTETAHLLAHLAGRPFSRSPVIKPLSDQPDALKTRTHFAASRFIAALAKSKPVIMVVDNLHLASEETVELIQHIAVEDGDAPLLIIATARREVFHRHPELGGPGIPVTNIELAPLEKTEIRELLSALSSPSTSPLPEKVYECAATLGGSPLSINGLFRLLVESDALEREEDGKWHVETAKLNVLALPTSIDELFSQRIGLLSRSQRDILAMAAVAGPRFEDDAIVALRRSVYLKKYPDGPPLDVLTESGDSTRVDVARGLFRLRAGGWLSEVPTTSGPRVYRFNNVRVAELVENSLETEHCVRYHRFLAQRLLLSEGSRSPTTQENAGHHFQKSGDVSDAGACYRRAADFNRRRFLHREALRLYNRALDCVPNWNTNVRIHIFHDLGSVQETIGDYQGAILSFEQMLRLSWTAASRVKAAVAMNKIGRVWRARRDLDRALAFLERGKQLFEDEGDKRGVIGSLDDIGTTLHLAGRNQEAMAMIERSIGLGRENENPLASARSHAALGNIHRVSGNPESARSSLHRALDLRLAAGDRLGVISSRCDMAQQAYEFGDLDAAETEWVEALVGAEHMGALPFVAAASVGLGRVALEKAAFDKALSYFEESLQLAEDLDQMDLLAISLAGVLRADQGVKPHSVSSQEAIDLVGDLRELTDPDHTPLVRGQAMLALAKTRGDSAKATTAPNIEKAIALFKQVGAHFETARAYEELAALQISQADTKNGKVSLGKAAGIYKYLASKRLTWIEKKRKELS